MIYRVESLDPGSMLTRMDLQREGYEIGGELS